MSSFMSLSLILPSYFFPHVLSFDPKIILTCGPIFPNLLDDNGFDWCTKNDCHCCVTRSRGGHGKRKVGGRGYDNGICKYNKGKKTKKPQPKEEGIYEFTNSTT
jgi:hypothetical protein